MDGDMDGGASAFAGGGFMPAPSTPAGAGTGGGAAFSPSAGGGRRGSTALYPFTIRHLAATFGKEGGDVLLVNAQEINNVVLAGRVVSLEQRTTDVTFVLDDGTGKVEIRKWHDDTEQEKETLSSVRVGTHVKVHGMPRKLGARQSISANSVRPITDFNEYTCHFLDCILAYQYSKGPNSTQLPGGSASAFQQRPGPGPPLSSHLSAGAKGPPAGPYGTSQGVSGPSQTASMGLPLHDRVLKYFADNEKFQPEGLHRDAVARSIPGASAAAVIEAIDFLVNEGHLYSTIDDVHFKTLENH